MTRTTPWTAVSALAALLFAPTASAQQEPTAAAVSQARDEFDRGVDAAHHGDWDRAHRAFGRAYELLPVPLTLLNLATADAQTGHLVRSVERFHRFLDEATSGPAADHRDEAVGALARIEPRIAHTTVVIRGLGPGDALVIDDEPLPRVALETPVPLDPRGHSLQIRRDGVVVASESFVLRDGEARRLVLTVLAPQRVAIPTPHPAASRARPVRTCVTCSPWFWGTLIGSVVVVGGVATGVLVSLPASGNLSPGRGSL